jgi:hypothetical protein
MLSPNSTSLQGAGRRTSWFSRPVRLFILGKHFFLLTNFHQVKTTCKKTILKVELERLVLNLPNQKTFIVKGTNNYILGILRNLIPPFKLDILIL